jgi:hypothetical protein
MLVVFGFPIFHICIMVTVFKEAIRMSWFNKLLLIGLPICLFNTTIQAEDFYLDSPNNKGALRFEIDNDAAWKKDSNFSNGWSLQYHTVRYSSWEEAETPGFVKWVGKNFPTLDHKDAIVRIGHGIGQNMMTPGDLSADTPLEGDLPYAGSLTYSLSWQSFNRRSGRNLQVTAGVLGPEAFANEFQKFVHNDLGRGEDPKGWDTQRQTEPILNIAYQNGCRLAHVGKYTNDWGGQFDLGSRLSLGNLYTAIELGLGFRLGWNILEGFGSFPAPPGVGIFQASYLPKPVFASPHSVELILGAIGTGVIYSVVYDGSLITNDDRAVERDLFLAAAVLGFNYHYHKLFSVRVYFQASTDLLQEESIPDSLPGKDKTHADPSFGALIVDFHF